LGRRFANANVRRKSVCEFLYSKELGEGRKEGRMYVIRNGAELSCCGKKREEKSCVGGYLTRRGGKMA